MPGWIVFKPIEAKFTDNAENIDKVDPVCKFKIGHHSGSSVAARPIEGNVKWSDYVKVPRNHDETIASFKVKDKGMLGMGKVLGEGKIDLELVMANKRVTQWYDLYDKDEIAGQVLVDVEYCPPI